MVLFDFLYLVVIILSLPLWLKFLFKKKYCLILKHRLSPGINPGNKKRIWIHAVSVGEVKSLGSLIEQLLETYDRDVVLSVTTPSGFEFAKKEYKDIRLQYIQCAEYLKIPPLQLQAVTWTTAHRVLKSIMGKIELSY